MSEFSHHFEAVKFLGGNACSIDLGYPLNESTVFWPGGEGFQLCMSCAAVPLPPSSENEPTSYYDYAAGVFSCAEHGGTHVDAPFHFCKSGVTVDEIPLQKLIGPCRVINISNQCSQDRNYQLTVGDIEEYERSETEILSESDIVIIVTGWSQHYSSGAVEYLGFDESTQGPYNSATSTLSFPGIGPAAAELLVQRKIAGVGIDTASLDPGNCSTFDAHRILLANGIYGIENLSGAIAALPPSGASIVVLPMKITGGSGAPARVVALLCSPQACYGLRNVNDASHIES